MTQCKIDLMGNAYHLLLDMCNVQIFISHAIKVMNVQLQDNGYTCGEYGEDPTLLHYKEMRSHFKKVCVDTYSITPFPSTIVSHQPRVVQEIRKRVCCKCRAPDNVKPMIRCCACRHCFHPECIGVGTQTDKWKCLPLLKHFDSCACFTDYSCLM